MLNYTVFHKLLNQKVSVPMAPHTEQVLYEIYKMRLFNFTKEYITRIKPAAYWHPLKIIYDFKRILTNGQKEYLLAFCMKKLQEDYTSGVMEYPHFCHYDALIFMRTLYGTENIQ